MGLMVEGATSDLGKTKELNAELTNGRIDGLNLRTRRYAWNVELDAAQRRSMGKGNSEKESGRGEGKNEDARSLSVE